MATKQRVVQVVEVEIAGQTRTLYLPEALAREFCSEHPRSFLVIDWRVSTQDKGGQDEV